MTGIFEEHKSRKRGTCSDCGVCKCCNPSGNCQIKDSNVNWKRKAKRLGISIGVHRNRTPKASATPRRSKRSSELRGRKRKVMAEEDDDIDLIHRDEYGILSGRSNKDILSQVCNILDINTSVLEMPKGGFTEEAMDTKARALSRGTRIVRTLLARICDLVSPSNAKFKD